MSFSREFSRVASIALLLLLAGGCVAVGNYRATPVPPELLPAYTLELEVRGQPQWDADRYEITFGFELRANDEFPYNAVVQEIVQEVIYRRYDGREIRDTLTLVEAFRLSRVGLDEDLRVVYRLPAFQRDRHFERGYLSVGPMIETVDVWRVVRFYPAYIEGVDETDHGFSHLPQNRDGSIVTDIPGNFNESHQRAHELKGAILQDDRQRARWYYIRYHWYREPEGGRPQATFDFQKYARPKNEPTWLSNTLESGVRHASAGE
jgi:hypothetical protein